MKVKEYNEPFHHLVIDDFLPKDVFNRISNKLHSIDCQSPDIPSDYKRYSGFPSCVPIMSEGFPPPGDYDCIRADILQESIELKNYFSKNITPHLELIEKNFHYKGYFEIARDSFHPHNDNALPNLHKDRYYAGVIKGVLYFAKEDIEYENYGTFLYDIKSEQKVKEIEYVPNRVIMFDTGEYTYHSTDYHSEYNNITFHRNNVKPPSKLKEKRFSFNFELSALDELHHEYVEKLYSDINYPNSYLLKNHFTK